MKKLTLIILLASVFQFSAFSQGVSDLDEFILEQMDIHHVPGLSACIIIEDSIYWNNNYGYMILEDSVPVHDSTLFSVFSIGKSITTACIMQLWDNQLIGLDQNINDFIPFQVSNPHNGIDSITARMMMTHTSTIDDWNLNYYITLGDPTESLGSFMENYLDSTGNYYVTNNYYNEIPGTDFNYDNYGMAMLGYLVEPLTGLDFNQYAGDSLLSPLDMTHSSWLLDYLNTDNLATGYTYSGGNFTANGHYGHPAYPGLSLRSTALDLANFNIMLLNQGAFNGLNIISEAAIDSMTTVQDPTWTSSFGPTGLGLFVREDLGDRIVWGHNGGSSTLGYAAHLYFCSAENSGVVITTNSGQYVPDLVEYLFDYALSVTTSIPNDVPLEKVNLKVYPNPASDRIQIAIDYKQSIEEIRIFNQIGQQVYRQKYSGNNIDISAIQAGIYILEARMEEGVVRHKFVKK